MPDYERLINAIDAAEYNAYGSDSDSDLESERAQAIDYYLGKNVKPAPDGRSQVVDRSVYETIQSIMPSLCRIFANGDDVVELPPIGPDDEESAKQEAAYLNYILLQKNPWFEVFRTAAMDALLTKAGYLYVYKDKRSLVEVERYEKQTADGLALLLQDEGVELTEAKEYPDPSGEPDPMTGMPAMLYDVAIRKTREENRFCVRALPPERCKISELTEQWHLRECPYFEYWDYCTVSDLRSEGYEVEDLDEGQADTEEDQARDQYSEDRDGDEVDPAMRRVKKRMIWIQYDYDEDGIAEMQYVLRVGKKVLYREEVSRIPVGVLCPDPLPHRHVGLSTADVTIEIQDQKTAILRQGLDNLYLTNNQRTFVNPDMVNLDDLMVNRPGGVVRGKGIFGQDIAPMPVPFVFPQAMEGLEYMDQVRENRTGVNRYFTGLDQNALNKTATGIQQLSTMAAQRVEQIARVFAFGIEDVCSLMHELVLKSGHKGEVVKLRGKWVQVDPATWRNRYDFRISVGFSAGNKDAQVSRLMMIAAMQEKALAGGLPIADARNVYETAMELTKAADFAAPERFWTDPSTVPPKPPPQPDPTVMAVEQLKSTTTLQKAQMDNEQKERDSQRDAQIKVMEIETGALVQTGLADRQAKLTERTEEMRLAGQAGLKQLETHNLSALEREKFDRENSAGVEMAQQVQQMAAELKTAVADLTQSLATVLTAKRQIRRGKDGRAEGVDLIGPDGGVIMSQNVERGPDGRVVGAQ